MYWLNNIHNNIYKCKMSIACLCIDFIIRWPSWSLCSLKYIKNDLVKFLPEGAVGDQEEMAQLDGEPVLCCGPEAAEAPFIGEQRSERRDSTVHPEQEQLPDPNVEPSGGERQHQPADLSVWWARAPSRCRSSATSRTTSTDQSVPSNFRKTIDHSPALLVVLSSVKTQ